MNRSIAGTAKPTVTVLGACIAVPSVSNLVLAALFGLTLVFGVCLAVTCYPARPPLSDKSVTVTPTHVGGGGKVVRGAAAEGVDLVLIV